MPTRLLLSLGFTLSILASQRRAFNRNSQSSRRLTRHLLSGRKGDGRFCRWLFLGHSGRF